MVNQTVRNTPDRRPLLWAFSILLLGAALLVSRPASPQELSAGELEELVSPVALYPDDVLGIILPASTFPLDIVRAARFLEDREDDASLEPDPEWDDSIVALLNYPEVLRLMDENIDWTWELGEAVLTDQEAVLEAAQDFRSRALAAGNLQSDDRQTVTNSNGAITIAPADPQVVYIPVYEPREIVVYQPAPIWHYYPVAYPVYYYPYPYGYSFNVDFFWGVTSYFSIGWHSHYVHVHHHTHHGHPYYLNSYYSYAPYYPRNHVNLTVVVNDHDHVWVPSPRRGGRPEMVSVEGRASAARMTRTASVESQGAGAPRANSSRMAAADAPSTRSSSPSARGSSPSTRSSAPSTRSESSGNGNAGTRTMRTPQATDNGNAVTARPSTRQSATTSGSTSTRMSSQQSARPAPQSSNRPSAQTRTQSSPPASARGAPQTSARVAPQTSSRPAPQTSARTGSQTSTRSAPQAQTTRMAPQSSSRPSPQASARTAPPATTQRSMSSSQPSSSGSARSGSSSAPRMQGTARSGGGNGSSGGNGSPSSSSSSSRQSRR